MTKNPGTGAHGDSKAGGQTPDQLEIMFAKNELKAALEKAEELSVMKDKFVSLVAHDLRSPFTSIIGLLKTIENDSKNPLHQAHKNTLDRVIKTSYDMLSMIDELLDIGRLRSGAIKARPKFFNLHSLASAVIENLQGAAEQKRVGLLNETPGDIRLYADRNLFREVLHNLLTNAIKFSHPGGHVRVFVPKGHKSSVAVEDCGVGIPLDVQPKVFKHEERTSTMGTSGERGTGLGLPFSNDIMALHGGTIGVRSQPGQGSVFTATLPYHKPLIHFVDDDPNLHHIAYSYMEDLDVDMVFGVNGKSALEAMRAQPPHVVVSDIQMPVMGGFELLGEMKGIKEFKDVPVVLITSNNDLTIREKAFRAGAKDFISKPLLKEELVPRISRFLT